MRSSRGRTRTGNHRLNRAPLCLIELPGITCSCNPKDHFGLPARDNVSATNPASTSAWQFEQSNTHFRPDLLERTRDPAACESKGFRGGVDVMKVKSHGV